ncbi:MAG TPA: methionine synthase [Trebonia sp.]|nr:methionine synthase [Trebonia sp.]
MAENSAVNSGSGYPWQPGVATGIGSLPGTHPMEAARAIVAELPDFPHLAELPERGPGGDMIGRAAALLVDITMETTPRGWRLSPERPGRDLRRARSMLSQDLDALEEVLDGYSGLLKLQVAGPWTLAATLEQPHSLQPALADAGAVADIAASLAEGAAAHVAEVAKRVPGARIIMQFDEPALPAVIEGSVPTASGLSRVRAVEEEVVRERLQAVLTAVRQYRVVHCCADSVPFSLIRGCGADAVSFDLSQLRGEGWDALAETAEAGLGLLVGTTSQPPYTERAVPSVQRPATPGRPQAAAAPQATAATVARSVADAWRRMGLSPDTCAPQVVITPACGLAGASPEAARAVLKRCREAARILPEIMEEQRLWSLTRPAAGTRSSTRRCWTPSTGITSSTRRQSTTGATTRGSAS